MIVRRDMLFVAALLAMAGFAETAVAQTEDDRLIVVGERVGRVHLGMPTAQLRAEMGVPSETTQFPNLTQYSFGALAVDVRGGRVVKIYVRDPAYTMANGLHVGSADIDVRALLGEPVRVVAFETIRYALVYRRGLVIGENQSGMVTDISLER